MSVTPARDTQAAAEAWRLLMPLFHDHRRRFMSIAQEFELAPAQIAALKALGERGSIPMSELAGELHCDTSNVTGIVDRLEQRGLVLRRSAPHDRRVKLLVLTDEGRRVREEIRGRLATPPAALDRLSNSEQRTLRDLLAKALDR